MLLVVCAVHAVLPHRDKYLRKAGLQKCVRCLLQRMFIVNFHAAEQLGLEKVRLERVDFSQQAGEFPRLCGGNRVAEQRHMKGFGNIADRLGGQVGIDHTQGCVADQIGTAFQVLRGQVVVNLHVRDSKLHIAVFVCDEHVCGGRPARHSQRFCNVDARASAASRQLRRIGVLAQRGDELYLYVEHGEVLRDVPSHTAGGKRYPPRVRVLLHQRGKGFSGNIDIRAADHNDIRRFLQNVALAKDPPFFHQVRNMHRHGGT